jgi:hypothetical protein
MKNRGRVQAALRRAFCGCDGPEDTVVTGIVESVDVGEDENGKTLTSLVVVPGDVPVRAAKPKWGGPLTLFRRALSEACLARPSPTRYRGDP